MEGNSIETITKMETGKTDKPYKKKACHALKPFRKKEEVKRHDF